jgi:hypothetical protein
MRTHLAATVALLGLGLTAAISSSGDAHANPSADDSGCHARLTQVGDLPFRWYAPPQQDATELESWCRAVGVPVVSQTSAGQQVPELQDLVVISTSG